VYFGSNAHALEPVAQALAALVERLLQQGSSLVEEQIEDEVVDRHLSADRA
jgi:hypothetical protein